MKHDWEDIPSTVADPHWYGRRRCRNCGAVQTKEDLQNWGRVIGYRWFPLAGRCKPKMSERKDLKVGDAVEWRGERWVAVMYDRDWFFQPAKKDGTAHKGRALQRLIGYTKIRDPD